VEIKKAFGSDEAVKLLLQMSQGVRALETNIQSVARGHEDRHRRHRRNGSGDEHGH